MPQCCRKFLLHHLLHLIDIVLNEFLVDLDRDWETAANEPLVMSFEGNGVRFETAAFVDVTNCDFVVAYYN